LTKAPEWLGEKGKEENPKSFGSKCKLPPKEWKETKKKKKHPESLEAARTEVKTTGGGGGNQLTNNCYAHSRMKSYGE